MTETMTATAALDRLETLYTNAVANLRDAVRHFLATGERADVEARAKGLFSYPSLKISWFGDRPTNLPIRSYARMSRQGVYSTTVTRPDLYRPYLMEQLTLLQQDYDVTFEVGPSEQEIPFPYVLDGSDVVLNPSQTAAIARYFPTTDLAHIGDEISDGLFDLDEDFPLSQFDGLRTDFSLARLRHYTGTPVEHVQSYILFTNYNRYVDDFVRWACEQLKDPNSIYETLSCAGGVVITRETADPEAAVMDAAWKKHQMPAYHLTAPGSTGITLVNIGVGPSNAKTICDHLAVMRPEAWLMIGHCGGLRPSQTIGDYVLAHAYLRDDHVLDGLLPKEIPIPAIAEIQQALFEATVKVTGEDDQSVKSRLRTGTVITTDDRNWELQHTQSALRFNQSRAVAIDMESATVAAQGYRFRVPYGTLLCVSDKPLHGEIKLPGQANAFYERSISQHLRIGIETLTALKRDATSLHSRKLRSFDEPPFR